MHLNGHEHGVLDEREALRRRLHDLVGPPAADGSTSVEAARSDATASVVPAPAGPGLEVVPNATHALLEARIDHLQAQVTELTEKIDQMRVLLFGRD